TMVDALEAGVERVLHHLRGPLPGRGDLLTEHAGNTVSEIDPPPAVHGFRPLVVSAGGQPIARWAGSAWWVQDESSEVLAGGGVDDSDVQVLDEDAGSADADRVEPPGMAEGDIAAGIDAVDPDSVVGIGGAIAGWPGAVWLGTGAADTVRTCGACRRGSLTGGIRSEGRDPGAGLD
ncbi:MAG TPA: hypothetical protein VF053_02600, partial [Streptosporangiales bacterium]